MGGTVQVTWAHYGNEHWGLVGFCPVPLCIALQISTSVRRRWRARGTSPAPTPWAAIPAPAPAMQRVSASILAQLCMGQQAKHLGSRKQSLPPASCTPIPQGRVWDVALPAGPVPALRASAAMGDAATCTLPPVHPPASVPQRLPTGTVWWQEGTSSPRPVQVGAVPHVGLSPIPAHPALRHKGTTAVLSLDLPQRSVLLWVRALQSVTAEEVNATVCSGGGRAVAWGALALPPRDPAPRALCPSSPWGWGIGSQPS